LEALSIGDGIDAQRGRDSVNFTLRWEESGWRANIKIGLGQNVQYRDSNKKHSFCAVHHSSFPGPRFGASRLNCKTKVPLPHSQQSTRCTQVADFIAGTTDEFPSMY
jgi:hypothetical protein